MKTRKIRIALLVPSSNTVMENDLHWALPKDRYSIHTDRMYLVETTREAETAMIEKYARPAATDVGTVKPDLLVFGCTSGGSLFGLEFDESFSNSLGDLAGCPALGTASAAARALTNARAKRLALIAPYNEDLTDSVAKALSDGGREVVAAHGMGITDNVELATPTPHDIVEFARQKLKGLTFDTLFLSCTNFRSFEAKSELERIFGTKVLTSNSSVVEAIEARFVDSRELLRA